MMKIRPPFGWKTMAVAAVLVVGIVAAWFFVGKTHRRQEFVCDFGSAHGYQCRFMLGAGWRVEEVSTDNEIYFFHSPSDPVQRWLQDHLLHRSSDDYIQFRPQPIIDPKHVTFQNGYPAIPGNAVPKRHLIIDGCPATVETYQSSESPSTWKTQLFLYSPNKKMYYEVVTGSYRKGDQIDSEMQAIIASFHVDKVGGEPGDKR